MTITLTREEAQQVLDAMQHARVFVTSREKIKQPEGSDLYDAAIKTLRARLAQPEPEPVAQPEPEPVAWHEPGAYGSVTVYKKWAKENRWHPLYTAPPQREWQGLTAYEIQELHLANPNWGDFACAIEAKLKEKNT
jgi:hypothetical protein